MCVSATVPLCKVGRFSGEEHRAQRGQLGEGRGCSALLCAGATSPQAPSAGLVLQCKNKIKPSESIQRMEMKTGKGLQGTMSEKCLWSLALFG